MSKYVILDDRQYRYQGLDSDKQSSGNEYTQKCKEYIDSLLIHDPKGIVIVSSSELDVEVLFGECITYLEDWCSLKGRRVTIFSPAWPYSYSKPHWVDHHIMHGFDQHNFSYNSNFFKLSNSEFSTQLSHPWVGDNFSPDLLYTCYNNRTCDYRDYTLDELAKNNLLDKGIVTYRHLTVTMVKDINWHPEYWPFNHIEYGTVLEDPLENNFVLHTNNTFPQDLGPSYGRGLIDIVTESRIDENEFYMSEKTNKPILTHKPFLVVGSAGYHKWLKEERHIELYDEIFDYSFDDEPDYKKRVEGIIANMNRLSEEYKTPEDYKRLYAKIKDKAIHNFWAHIECCISGVHQKSFFDFISLNSKNSTHYLPDNRSIYFHNNEDWDNVKSLFQWFNFSVIPHAVQPDLKSHVPNYEEYFKNIPVTVQRRFLNSYPNLDK